ncbi:hypothetical protein [Macromonas bipunctata]|uniref:hypothetical protein n=1 Tax=Macromonas bipunctata TaxID=183670 RepID=UPI0011AFB54E|nr:hypothetical protein [Macromonas bipunctata]
MFLNFSFELLVAFGVGLLLGVVLRPIFGVILHYLSRKLSLPTLLHEHPVVAQRRASYRSPSHHREDDNV